MPLKRWEKIWNIGIILVFLASLAQVIFGLTDLDFSAGLGLGLWTILAADALLDLVLGRGVRKNERAMLDLVSSFKQSPGPGTH